MFELPNVPGSPMFSIDPKTHPNVFDTRRPTSFGASKADP